MSGREKTYDLYKAQRPPRPDLLREQWPHLMPLVEAFGYTNVRVEGYEADDVIGTLAREAREAGIPVMVVSGDRDVYQLVGDGIRVMTTSRGVTETKIYDRDGVVERYGVPPELVTDLIGLKGDTSDNIPGVPGIGEKTGAAAAAGVRLARGGPRQRREGLRRETEAEPGRARRGRAGLKAAGDAPVRRRDRHRLRRGDGRQPDRSTLREFMREFELRAVMERLEEGLPDEDAVPGRSVETELEVEVVEGTPEDLREGGAAMAIAGDRWAAAQGDRIVGGSSTLDELAVALGDRPLAGHDLKSLGGGRHGLLAAAVREGVELELDHDTMIAAYLLEPQRRTYELTELAADAGIGLAEGAGQPTEASPTRASSPSARSRRPASTLPRRRGWSRPWPMPSGPASRSSS